MNRRHAAIAATIVTIISFTACGGDDQTAELNEIEEAADDAREAVEELEATLDSIGADIGGIDRAGSRDAIIESLEAQGITVDGDCIDAVFDKYTDDQLSEWDEELQGDSPSEEAQAWGMEVLACADLGS